METLLIAIVILIVLAMLVWIVNAAPDPPIKQPFKWLIIFLLVIVACIFLLRLVGIV